MQTLSPTISPTISKTNKPKVNELDELLPAIAQSTVLKNTLSGLDASLNDELDRYRHWKENGQTISYLNPFRPRVVSTQSIWSSPSLSDTLSPLTPVTGEVSESDRHTIQMPVMPSLNLENAELHRYQGMVSLDSLSNSLDNKNPEQVNTQRLDNNFAAYPSIEPNQNLQIPNLQSEAGSIGSSSSPNEAPLKSGFAAEDDDEILQRFANDYAENYYETSPDLAADAPKKGTIRSLMNPVGIISLLLLLCSSAAIGYLMVDPSGVMKLLKPEQSPKTTSKDLGKDGSLQQIQTGNAPSQSFIPFAGDKSSTASRIDPLTGKPAAKSAIASKNPLTNSLSSPLTNPLGNPTNSANPLGNTSDLFAPSSTFVPSQSQSLRTVPPAALPPISVAPLPPSAPAPVERSYSAPSRTYEPAPAPRYEPAPAPRRSTAPSRPAAAPPVRTTVTVTPKPAPVRSAAIANPPAPRSNVSVKYAAPLSAAPAPSSNSSYRIVVENSYASSAQQVERDAFVRPSDGQVQMGSFRDQNTAQQRIEELRRQGIPARIE